MLDAPMDPRALLARARTRAGFHRFNDALDNVDRAEQLSLDAETANAERAAIYQALGRYDEAFELRKEAVKRQPSFENFAGPGRIACRARRTRSSRTAVRAKPLPISRCFAVPTGSARVPDGTHVDERWPTG